MSSRRLRQENLRHELETRLQRLKNSSTFRPFGVILEHCLHSTADDQIVPFITEQLRKFPPEETDTFLFDRAMTASIVRAWSVGLPLSPNLIPVYTDLWGYERVQVPSLQVLPADFESLFFLYFPWSVNERVPLLLEYPWILHELGHHALKVDETEFRKGYDPQLDAFLMKLELATLSFQGQASSLALKSRDTLESYWRPSDNHYNWAHEMAIDLIALWAGGPAYLAAFYENVRDRLDPFNLTQSHPPLALRLLAILQTADRLGWRSYLGELSALLARWDAELKNPAIKNAYTASARTELLDACIAATLLYCEAAQLPRLTPSEIPMIVEQLEAGEALMGTELIVAAWHVGRTDAEGYDAWEEKAVTEVVEDIKREHL